jgi:diketogulonate reductase-like aldo/keto reductase
MVVQNKFDVYHVGKQLDNQGDDVVEFARSQGIIIVAYSTFSSYPFVLKPLNDPIVKYIAQTLSGPDNIVTPAQVLLKWSMQKGSAVIPRSSDRERLVENYKSLFLPALSQSAVDLIDSLQFLVSSSVSTPVQI